MSNPLIKAVVATLIQVVLIFDQQSVQAEFSDTCDNSNSSLSCIYTYEQLYNSLTKSDNSFNIGSALYPVKKASSVRVFVNLHGPNKTGSSIARYTWSLSCLYVAVPLLFLEIVSLGSILVGQRTEELNLTIPNFCCNVSKTEDERKEKINDMIKNVLAELQDLASSPGIRNPELNNAECVVEGHGTDIQATGHSHGIRIIIWSSTFFTCAAFSPLYEKTIGSMSGLKTRNIPRYKAILYLSFVVGLLGSFTWTILLNVLISYIMRDGVIFYLEISLILFFLLYIFPLLMVWWCCLKNCATCDRMEDRGFRWFRYFLAPSGVIYTSFSSCWVLVGMILNPIWGLTVAVTACLVITSFIYIVDSYEKVRYTPLKRMWVNIFVAVISLTLIVIFTGQSFNGRETADEIFSAVLFAAVVAATSLLTKRGWKRFTNQKAGTRKIAGKESSTQPPFNDPSLEITFESTL